MDSELLDVVDVNNKVIGKATREDCHNNPNLIHRTIHFTVIDREQNTILLTRRSFSKKHDPGKYCFPGEHMKSGEDYKEAIARGLKEELNLTPKIFITANTNIFKFQKETEFVAFYITECSDYQIEFDRSELEEIIWVNLDQIKNLDLDLSEMTKYWIQTVKWKGFFKPD